MVPPVCGFHMGLICYFDQEHKSVIDIDTKNSIGSEKDLWDGIVRNYYKNMCLLLGVGQAFVLLYA